MFVDEIVARLVAASVGTFGTSIFAGSKATIPTGDGPYLTLMETGGSGSMGTHNNTAVERPTMQLVSRATKYPDARAQCAAAYAALGGANGLYNTTLSGVFYLKIKARQCLTDIGTDEIGRPQIAFNIEVEKQPS